MEKRVVDLSLVVDWTAALEDKWFMNQLSTTGVHKPLIIVVIWCSGWWFQPLWKIWKSVGIIPNIWKNKIDVPNHQSVLFEIYNMI